MTLTTNSLVRCLAVACLPLVFARTLAAQDDPPAWTLPELEALSLRIQGEVAALRGATFVRPVAVRVASKADLIEYAKSRMAELTPPEQVAADEIVAKLLGVIPPDMDLLATELRFLEEQVGGFYDPLSDSFSLMDSVPRGLAAIVLAHELDHALDDQLYSLDDSMLALSGQTDASLAYQALVEGSGTTVMNQWLLQHKDQIDIEGSESIMEASAASMATAPMWLWKPMLAAYMCGAAFLGRTDNVLQGQLRPAATADLTAAFTKPPRSTEQVLHPEKYWDPAHADEPLPVSIETGALPAGWSVAREDTLGELVLSILCTLPTQRGGIDAANPAAMLGVRYTNELAAGWGGDRLKLFTNGTAKVLVLATRWDSARDAAEFAGALELLLPTFEDAATALAGDGGGSSGAELARPAEDQVVLTVRSGVPRRDWRGLEKALGR